jgi:uncharacterized protein YjbI with pentapeptide repeats
MILTKLSMGYIMPIKPQLPPSEHFKALLASGVDETIHNFDQLYSILSAQPSGDACYIRVNQLHGEMLCHTNISISTGQWIIEGNLLDTTGEYPILKWLNSSLSITGDAKVWIRNLSFVAHFDSKSFLKEDLTLSLQSTSSDHSKNTSSDYSAVSFEHAKIQANIMCEQHSQLWVSDFAISCQGGHALYLMNFDRIDLYRVRFYSSDGCGLFAQHRPQHDDQSSHIQDASKGILLCQHSEWIANGKLQKALDNGEEESDGVWYNHPAHAYFYECVFQENQGDGLYAKCGTLSVQDCDFTNNEVNGLYYGIQVKGEVRHCRFKGNKIAQIGFKGAQAHLEDIECLAGPGLAIFVLEGSVITAQNLSIVDHEGCGLLIDAHQSPILFEGNHIKITRCQDGVIALHESQVSLKNFQSSSHKRAHLSIADQCKIHLENAVMQEAQVGIMAQDNAYHLTGNDIHIIQSSMAHIYLDASDQPDHWQLDTTQKFNQQLQSMQNQQRRKLTLPVQCEIINLHTEHTQGSSIIMKGQITARFSDCQIMHAQSHHIQLSQGSMISLEKTRLSHTDISALFVHKSYAKLTHVHIDYSQKSHVLLCNMSYATLDHVTLQQSQDAGLYMTHYAFAQVQNCEIAHNASAGVWLEFQSYLYAKTLHVHHHKYSGSVFVRDCSTAILHNVHLQHHAKAGIECMQHSNLEVSSSCIENGDNAGIIVRGDSQAFIQESNILAHALVQIAIQSQSQANLVNNMIAEGKGRGLLFERDTVGRVIRQWIYNQDQDHQIERGAKVFWEDNIVEEERLSPLKH